MIEALKTPCVKGGTHPIFLVTAVSMSNVSPFLRSQSGIESDDTTWSRSRTGAEERGLNTGRWH